MKVVTAGGQEIELGTVETTPTISLVDFSRRETDEFGVTTVVERGFARRMAVRLSLPFDDVDRVQQKLSDLRATAAQWVADPSIAWLNFQGFFKDFELDLAVPPTSFCTLTVEGLAETETASDGGTDPAPTGASTLRLLRPAVLTDPSIVSSSVAEDTRAEWASGTTYAAGTRIRRTTTHRVYESLAAGNIGHEPATSPDQWLDVGPTNRWAMLDEALGSLTSNAGSIAITLNAGTVKAVALLDVTASTVRVQTTGYDQTKSVTDAAVVFADLPGGSAAVTVTVTGTGTVSVGTLVLGPLITLGALEASPSAGISDFSRKETDAFGAVTVVPRAWAKRMSVRSLISTASVDAVANRVASVRARPSLWLGDDGIDSLTVYGFFKDFSIEIGDTVSTLALSVEGLSEASPISAGLPAVSWTDILDDDPSAPKPADGATRNFPRGDYAAGSTYAVGDIVVWQPASGGDGNTYQRIGSGNTAAIAPSDATKWALFGSRGASSVVGWLSNENTTVPTASDGTGYATATINGIANAVVGGSGSFQVWYGTTEVTGNGGVIYSIEGGADNGTTWTRVKSGLTLTINETTGAYTLSGTAWAADTVAFSLYADYAGVRVTRVLTISKAKAGAGGAAAKLLDLGIDRPIINYNTSGGLVANQISNITINPKNLSSGSFVVRAYRINTDGSLTTLDAGAVVGAGGAFTDNFAYAVADSNAYTLTSGSSLSVTGANFFSAVGTHQGLIVEVVHSDGVSDKVSILRVQDGAVGAPALTATLTNDSILLPAASDGTVSDFSNATGNIRVYLGGNEVTSLCTITAVTPSANLSVSVNLTDNTPTASQLKGYYKITGFTQNSVSDSGEVAITISYPGYTAITKKVSVGRSKAGVAAKTIALSATHNTFVYDGLGSPKAQSTTITAVRVGTNSTTFWEVYGINASTGALVGFNNGTAANLLAGGQISSTANNDNITITQAKFAALLGSTYSGLVITAAFTDGVTYKDQVSIVKLQEGSNAITAFLSNDSHLLPADKDGGVLTYSGATGSFRVFAGATEISHLFTLTTFANPQGIGGSFTAGSAGPPIVAPTYTLTSVPSSPAYDVHNWTIRATGSGAYSTVVIDKTFTATKSKTGATGGPGANAKIIDLAANTNVIKYDATDKLVVNQSASLTVNKQNLSSATVTVNAYRINQDGSTTQVNANLYVGGSGSIVAAGNSYTMTGTTISVLGSDFNNAITGTTVGRGLIIEVVHPDGVSDRQTIMRVTDGAVGGWTPVTSGPLDIMGAGFKHQSSGDWNAQVYSKEKLLGAKVSFRPVTVGTIMIGLDANPSANDSYSTIDFAAYLYTTGYLYAYENGSQATGGLVPYTSDDIISVEQRDDVVFYSKNGVPWWVSQVTAPNPLGLDSSFANGEVQDVSFGPAAPLPDFFQPGRQAMAQAGNVWTKVAGGDGWGDAGFISSKGYAGAQFSFTVPAAAMNMMIGLAASRKLAKGYTQIDKAIYFTNNVSGSGYYAEDRQLGVSSTVLTPFSLGDKITFRHDGTIITVLKNGSLWHTFTGVSASALWYAMADLYTSGVPLTVDFFGQSGVNGTRPDIKFIRSNSQPATPTGDNPAGWSDGVPAGTGRLWTTRGTKSYTGTLLGAWSIPASLNDLVSRGPYNAASTYYLYDTVTYNGGTYIALGTTTGNAPSGNAQGNAYWDVLAAPGEAGAAGGSTPPSAFTATINLTSSTGSNLRSLADAAGYAGGDATITFNVPSGVTIRGVGGLGSGVAGGKGIDTGSWPAGKTLALTLVVQSGGIVDGGGGAGGDGASSGGPGGDAVYLRVPINVTVNSGGTLRGGGGGGGGSAYTYSGQSGGLQRPYYDVDSGSASGAGGGQPNGGPGYPQGDGSMGTSATTSSPGSPRGGAFGTAGANSVGAGGLGGAAGSAVRKNGFACTVTNNGTMAGAAA